MREYPDRPVPAVAACILDSTRRVLLVQRGQEPARGKWSFPGGTVRIGESLDHALKREVKEECGIDISVIELLEGVSRVVCDSEGRVQYHYVILDYLCEATDGKPKCGSDAADVRWFSEEALESIETTDGLMTVIQKGIKKAPFKGA